MKEPKFKIGDKVKYTHKDNFMGKPTEFTVFDTIRCVKWDKVYKKYFYYINYSQAEYSEKELEFATDYEKGVFYN